MRVSDAVTRAMDQAELNEVKSEALWWVAFGAACQAMPADVLEAERQARVAYKEWLVARHPGDAEFAWYIDETWRLAEALVDGKSLDDFDLDRLMACREKWGSLYGGKQ